MGMGSNIGAWSSDCIKGGEVKSEKNHYRPVSTTWVQTAVLSYQGACHGNERGSEKGGVLHSLHQTGEQEAVDLSSGRYVGRTLNVGRTHITHFLAPAILSENGLSHPYILITLIPFTISFMIPILMSLFFAVFSLMLARVRLRRAIRSRYNNRKLNSSYRQHHSYRRRSHRSTMHNSRFSLSSPSFPFPSLPPSFFLQT